MSFKAFGKVLVSVAALGFIGITLTAYFPGRGKEHQAEKVSLGSVAGMIEESGNIDSNEEYTYYSGVSAPIASIAVEKGDEVTKGQRLVEYDVEDFERNLSVASLTREQSENNSEGQIKQSNAWQAKYDQAVQDDNTYAVLYWWEREVNDNISEAQYGEDWNTQNRSRELNQCIAAKNEEIAKKQTALLAEDIDEEDYENISREISKLREDIASAQAELAGLPVMKMDPTENQMQNDVSNVMEDITRNWNETKTNKAKYEASVLNSSQKEALLDQVELAKENEAFAQIDLEKARQGITADFNGIVTECNVKAGSVVPRGTPLFTIVSRDDMKVTVMISRYDIGSVKVGQRAEIDALGTRYVGSVAKINRIATTDSTDKSKVAVDVKIDGGKGLILGLEADVRIYTDEKKDVMLIPYDAFYSDDDGDYCYIINNDGVIEKKYFTSGIVSSSFVEVLDGLSLGMTVITDAITDDQIGEKAFEAAH